jgi:hypothetical protein
MRGEKQEKSEGRGLTLTADVTQDAEEGDDQEG